MIAATLIKDYLKAIGAPAVEGDEITSIEVQKFAEEVSENSDMTKVQVLDAAGNQELLTDNAQVHIETVLGGPSDDQMALIRAAQREKEHAAALVEEQLASEEAERVARVAKDDENSRIAQQQVAEAEAARIAQEATDAAALAAASTPAADATPTE